MIFRTILCILNIGLMKSGRAAWQEEKETRKDFSIVLMLQEKFFRAFQGHSGRNLVDPSLQDNVLIPGGFFKYIYHVGCAINLHPIINSGLIPGSQNLSNRQTVFFLPVDPMDKEHKDPETWKHRVLHGTCIKHGRNIKTRCIVGGYQTCSKERIEVLSDAIERYHSLQYTPTAYCILKVVWMETGEII